MTAGVFFFMAGEGFEDGEEIEGFLSQFGRHYSWGSPLTATTHDGSAMVELGGGAMRKRRTEREEEEEEREREIDKWAHGQTCLL